MFRASMFWRGVSPFTLFLMDQKNNPALKGCTISKRGRILSKMYKELSQNQRRELKQRAARHPTLTKVSREKREAAARAAKGKVKGEFAKFVRDNYHKVKKLNYRKRFYALSQLYGVTRPLDIEKELAKALPKNKAKAKAKANTSTKAKAAVKSNLRAEKKASETGKKGKPTSGRKRIKKIASEVKRTR